MFTGIVTAVGEIRAAASVDGGREFVVTAPWGDLVPGESIAVDGACLTVTEATPGWFKVHVVATSLERTSFAEYFEGRAVNLERALRATDRLGGHLVQGHVDGIGTVLQVRQREDARLLDIGIPPAVADVSILLGSIVIDGVALTVNAIPSPGVIQVSLIPFTLGHTTLGARVTGDRVHVEGDTVGKYVKQLMQARRLDGEARC
jgi:riboflavin synthase